MRQAAVVFALLLPFFAAAAPIPTPAAPLTVDAIFRDARFETEPPREMAWSPDSKRLMYLDRQGNLMAIDGATGKQSVLIGAEKMKSLSDQGLSEWDRALIERYHEPRRFWTPNAKSILFIGKGRLWLFDIGKGVGLEIASVESGRGSNPQFSPNAEYLAYIRGNHLYVLRQGQRETPLTHSTKPTIFDGGVDWVYEEELGVRSNYFWSPDSKHLAYLEMDETGVPRYPIENLLSIHASLRGQIYPQPGDPSPAVRVGVVDVKGGKTHWIKLPEEEEEEGGSYIPRFGWLNSEILWVETLSRDQTHRTFYLADASRDHVHAILSQRDEKYLEPSYDALFLSSELLVTGWTSGYSHILHYHFDSAHPYSTTATFAGELGGGKWDVASICAINHSTRAVYYLSNEDAPTEQRIWAVNLDSGRRHLVSRESGWHEPLFSPDAQYYSDTVSSLTTPPVVKLCRDETNCHAFWTSPAPEVKLAPTTPLQFTAADGKTALYGHLVLPGGKAVAGSVPVILNPYGGPEAQVVTDQWNYRTALFDRVLAEHGFAVLRVDNRGMAGRGRDFAQAAYHNFGPVQLSDQLAALDQALTKFPVLDGKRVGWWGWSWGGTFTLYAMTHSSRIAAGVAVAPVTDWRDYDSIYTERYLGRPAANRQEYDRFSVLESAPNLQGRVLLATGLGDGNVHFENTVQFIDKLVEAGIPYELAIYPGKTHTILGSKARIDLYKRILNQFERYLKPHDIEANASAEKTTGGERAK